MASPDTAESSSSAKPSGFHSFPKAVDSAGSAPAPVICFGDNITYGLMGHNWIPDLQRQLKSKGLNYRVVNEGANGNLSYHIYQRLKKKRFSPPYPSVLVLQCGTNDILVTVDEQLKKYFFMNLGVPVTPSLENFADCVSEILKEMNRACPNAKIAVVSIPPVGEDVNSDLNAKVREYNRRLQEVVHQANDILEVEAVYLPFGEQLMSMLESFYNNKVGQAGVAEPLGATEVKAEPAATATKASVPPPFRPELLRMIWQSDVGVAKRYVLGRTSQQLSQANGLYLFVDHINVNEGAAKVLTELLEGFIVGNSPAGSTVHSSSDPSFATYDKL